MLPSDRFPSLRSIENDTMRFLQNKRPSLLEPTKDVLSNAKFVFRIFLIGFTRIAAEPETEKMENLEEQKPSGSRAAQLLGIRGATEEQNIWKIRLQLTKPVTWVPLVWGRRSFSSILSICFGSRGRLWSCSFRKFSLERRRCFEIHRHDDISCSMYDRYVTESFLKESWH